MSEILRKQKVLKHLESAHQSALKLNFHYKSPGSKRLQRLLQYEPSFVFKNGTQK